jgi:hypothetical protein
MTKMLCDFDLETLVDFTVRIYSREEMHEKLQKEERECPCHWDRRHCDKFSDDSSVEWQAFLFHRDIREGQGRFGVYARGERACGMVQFWDSDWMLHPASEHFWSYLFRRAEKQCGSISNWKSSAPSVPKAGQERKRAKHTWKQR